MENYQRVIIATQKKSGMGLKTLESVIQEFLTQLVIEVRDGDDVSIPQFGTFKLGKVEGRVLSFNTAKRIPTKHRIVFSLSPEVKQFLNNGNSDEKFKINKRSKF